MWSTSTLAIAFLFSASVFSLPFPPVLLSQFSPRLQRAIAAPGKGILAADESQGTIGKRFESIGKSDVLHGRYPDNLASQEWTSDLFGHLSRVVRHL